MARRGLHTNIDKDDSEGSDEVSEQDDSVTGTKIPINPVPVAMKHYLDVRNRYGMDGPEDELAKVELETTGGKPDEIATNVKNDGKSKALKNSCCKDKKRRLEVLQIKNNLKNSIYNILRKLKVFKICLGVDLEPDEWIKDSGFSKHITGNRKLFSTYKAYNGGNVIFGSNLRGNIIGKGQICDNKCRVTFSEHDSEITKDGKVIVIENGDSWVSVPQTSLENDITVTKMSTPATAEEKTNKKNDVKARVIETRTGVMQPLQKIVSRLAILGAIIAHEDLNLKILSSLPPEWNTHVVVWMNKPEFETMSKNDLYNNFKIVEQNVNKIVGTSSGGQNMAFITAPSTNSANEANTTCPQSNTSMLSDENLNGSNVLHMTKQIHEDDLEAMDLKWQLSLLSVECCNCHKLGHFSRECSEHQEQEGLVINQYNTRKQGNNEDTSLKAILVINGVGFDWSDMAEEQKQCDDLLVKLNETEFKATTYKRGLATLEDQIITYKKNDVLFSEEVAVLKREVGCKNYETNVLKSEFEKVKQEKDGIDFKIEKFDKASKDLDQLLRSQITDKSKKGLGYSAVPPPHPLIYNRPNKLDLSYSGLYEFKVYGPENSKQESNVVCEKESDNSKENFDESLVEEQVSQDKSSFVKSLPNINCHNHQRRGIVSRNNYNRVDAKNTHPNVLRNMSPKAVLLKTGLTPLNTVRPVNTAHPKTAVHSAKSKTHFSKQAQSTAKRPFYKQTTLTRRSVHEAKRHYYTGRHNAVNTARSYTGQVNAKVYNSHNHRKTE
ncbi:putative ribonuclease H-like domain-containing protein [Tanacetum coccineum]